MPAPTKLAEEIQDSLSWYQRLEPYLYDARAAQDVAIYMILPMHSQFLALAFSVYGAALALMFLAWMAVKGLFTGMRQMLLAGLGVVAVFVAAMPIEVQRGDPALYHNSGASLQYVPNNTPASGESYIISLAPYFMLRFVNDIEDLIFPMTSLYGDRSGNRGIDLGDGVFLPEFRDESPEGVMNALNMNYYSMLGDEEMMKPVQDYLHLCGNVPRDSGTQESLAAEWAAVGLLGSPTLGFNPTPEQARVILDANDRGWFQSMLNPLRRMGGQARRAAHNYLGNSPATDARRLLSEYHPNRRLGQPINSNGYQLPDEAYWTEVAKSGGQVSNSSQQKTYLEAPTNLQHPSLRTGASGSSVGGPANRGNAFYATNCLELYEIADLSMSQVYDGVGRANAPGAADAGWFDKATAAVTSTVLPERMLESYSTSQLGIMKAFTDRESTIAGAAGGPLSRISTTSPGDAGNPLDILSQDGMKEAFAGLGALFREGGHFLNLSVKLPDVVLMSVGIASMTAALALMLLPLAAMIGFVSGSISTIVITLRVILMMKLLLLLMFFFLKIGTEATGAMLLYQMQQAIVGQPNMAGVMPFVYTMQVAMIPFVTVVPTILAYMIAFAETRPMSAFSPGAPGQTNLRTGMAAGAAATQLAGGPANIARAGASAAGAVGGAARGLRSGGGGGGPSGGGGGGVVGARAGYEPLSGPPGGGINNRLPPPTSGGGRPGGGQSSGGRPGGGGRTFEVDSQGKAQRISGRGGLFAQGSTPSSNASMARQQGGGSQTQQSVARQSPASVMQQDRSAPSGGAASGPSQSAPSSASAAMDRRPGVAPRPSRPPTGTGNPNPRGTDRR